MPELTPPGRSGNQVADWLELVALRRGSAVGSDSLHELGRAVGMGDADISVGLTAMSRRAAQLGEHYPFRVLNGIAALPGATASAWTTLLLLSPGSPARASTPLAAAAVHLEQITAAALGGLFGPATQVVRFGWPSDEGRPPEFPDAIRWLAARMGAEVGSAYRPPFRKDGGVDVVAWRPFLDGRSGFPVVLAQCTLEQDYVRKAADVDLRVWAGWLRLDVDPMSALAVPTVVPHGETWNALAARTIVLDRPRLVGLLGGQTGLARMSQVHDWTRSALAGLQEDV
jgi:hypothetical protein